MTNGNGNGSVVWRWAGGLAFTLMIALVTQGFLLLRDRIETLERRQFDGQQRVSRLEAQVEAMGR